MLHRFQRGLEQLYRIETNVSIEDFVIDETERDSIGVSRRPREQLLLREYEGELDVGLFVNQDTLDNLTENDPTEHLGDHNFQDFVLAVEGVSHFVYAVWRAGANRPVSALELELQAEIDKYVSCIFTAAAEADPSRIRQRLFVEFDFAEDLDVHERSRYRVANENAGSYSESLEHRFVRSGRIGDMLSELRRFYRMSLGAKLDFIRQAA